MANLGFGFGNDQLQKAFAEYNADADSTTEERAQEAGDWCSLVLGCLGFEWV